MKTNVLWTCLAAAALCTQAHAITFTSTSFSVDAAAQADGPAGFASQSTPMSTLPLTVSADSVGPLDLATAGAIGAPGLLNTSADASSGGGIASAVGTSYFSGSFISDAQPYLTIDFSTLDFSFGTGSALTTAFMTLTSGGSTLFSGFLDSSTSFSRYFAPGTTGLLDLTLSSEAAAGFPTAGLGNGSAYGQVLITSAVPLPAPWLLMLTGLGPVFMAKKRAWAEKRRQPAEPVPA
jgi:hypothetical protein